MKSERNEQDETLDSDVAGALLEAQSPVSPPPALRARVLNRVQQAVAHGFTTTRAAQGWKALAPGIEVKLLFVDERAGTKSFLIRAQAGATLPSHRHHGDEECMVLEGEFTIGELTLRAGDYHLALAGSTHEKQTTITPVLVYLRGAIEDYPYV